MTRHRTRGRRFDERGSLRDGRKNFCRTCPARAAPPNNGSRSRCLAHVRFQAETLACARQTNLCMPLHQEEVEHVKINTETGAVATGAPSPPPSVAPVAVNPGRDWSGGKSPRMVATRSRPPTMRQLACTHRCDRITRGRHPARAVAPSLCHTPAGRARLPAQSHRRFSMAATRSRPPPCANMRATIGVIGLPEVGILPAPSRHRFGAACPARRAPRTTEVT